MEDNQKTPNHYNYQRLDSFLKNDYDPAEIGNHLDQIRDRLVELAHHREDYSKTLREDHYLLGELRDIFWALKKSEHGNS
ncbi:MAG: hypothetical protein ACKOE6_09910 [Flammeovirgaceae bacterium]